MSVPHIPLSPSDERVMSSLCSGARFLSIVLGILTFFTVIGGCLAVIGLFGAMSLAPMGGGESVIAIVLGAVVLLVVLTMAVQAWLLWKANTSLQLVVTTDGADQAHLMTGLRTIKTLFVVEVVLGILAMLGALIGAVGAFMSAGGVG